VTTHVTARARIVGGAAAALLVAGFLAGCAARPGVAAVVDGREIPASDVSAVLADLKDAAPALTAQNVLQILIEEPTAVQLASDEDVAVSDDDGKQLLDSVFSQAGVATPKEYASATLVVGKHQAAIGKLQGLDDVSAAAQEFGDRLGKLDVTVNPRYGTFDAGSVGDPVQPSWIVGAAAAAPTEVSTPAPTAS
jgi:SpoU rRNA methylase family enzyme